MKIFKGLKGLFITGTDTGIGKTVVAASLVTGLNGTYWKPVQTGIELGTDTDEVKKLTLLSDDHFLKESYRLKYPLSPHLSAQKTGIYIELNKIVPPTSVKYSPLIVEGAGGILVPLNNKEFMLDLIKKINFPVILVSSSKLGTINHTLLSLYVLKDKGIEVLGVVLNGEKNQGNKEAIEKFGKVKVLAQIEPVKRLSPEVIKKYFAEFYKEI